MNLPEFSYLQRKVITTQQDQELPNVGHAFGFVFLQEFYQEVDDVSELLTEGNNDLGIDAINIEDDIIDIFQFKYTDKYENKTNKVKDADLDKLENRIKQILNKESEILNYANKLVAKKIKRIWSLLEESPIKINAYFVTNYEDPVDENKLKLYKSSLKKSSVNLEIYGASTLMGVLKSNNIPSFDTKLKFSGKQYFEKSDTKVHSLTGVVNALNLIEALLNDEKEMDESIFEENVRVYLKRKGRINKQIFNSAVSQQNNNFFYFNNGVTITCLKIDYTQNSDSPIVKIDNLQIVNGSQTVHALFDVYQDPNLRERLSNVYLLTRIYATEDKELGQDIAMYTNTQNPVKSRDTRSNDDRQKTLASELATYGFKYQRKKNEESDGYSKDKIIDLEKAGQVMLSFYLAKPGDSKNKKTKIFDQDYEAIFDKEKLTAQHVLLPYLIYNKIEARIRDLKKEKKRLIVEGNEKGLDDFEKNKDYLLHSQYYTLLTCRYLAIQKKIEIRYENCQQLISLIDDANNVIFNLISAPKYTNKYPAEIFKQNSFVEDIVDYLKVII